MSLFQNYKNLKVLIVLIMINGNILNPKSPIAKIWLLNVKIDYFKVTETAFIFLFIDFLIYLEFDVWYNECYIGGNNPGGSADYSSSNKNPNNYHQHDDSAEKFERMQKELLLSDLDSMPFRQAQMQTNRRVSHSDSFYFF
jgi:hypothetical protein